MLSDPGICPFLDSEIEWKFLKLQLFHITLLWNHGSVEEFLVAKILWILPLQRIYISFFNELLSALFIHIKIIHEISSD